MEEGKTNIWQGKKQEESIKYLEFMNGTLDFNKLGYVYAKASNETVLNMLKEKDKEIEHLKENINYQTLCDFLISSVSADEEPMWTEKHIEELLENFEVRWENAYK